MQRYVALALFAALSSIAAQGQAAGGPRSITVEADEVVASFVRCRVRISIRVLQDFP